MNEPAYLEPLRAFYRKAQGNPTPQDKRQSEEYVAASEDQFSDICALMLKAQKALGEGCRFSGSKQSAGNVSAWITCDGFRFRVRYRFATRAQAVTDTSRAAYHTLDFSSERGRVADTILRLSADDVTRAEIAYLTGLEKSSVSGRVNELFDLCQSGPVKLRDALYTLEHTQKRPSDFPGAPAVSVQAFRFRKVEENRNVQPAAVAAQTKLIL